jgi:hypothetical protein
MFTSNPGRRRVRDRMAASDLPVGAAGCKTKLFSRDCGDRLSSYHLTYVWAENGNSNTGATWKGGGNDA